MKEELHQIEEKTAIILIKEKQIFQQKKDEIIIINILKMIESYYGSNNLFALFIIKKNE